MLETGDFRLLQNKYLVKFMNDKLEKPKVTVTLDYLRMTRDQMQ